MPSQLPSPRPRCCVLTGRSLYVIEEMAFTRSLASSFELCPYGHLVQACGSLRALGAVNADSHGTVHLVRVEGECFNLGDCGCVC